MQKYIKEFPRATWISLSIFIVLVLIRLLTGGKINLDFSLFVNLGYCLLYGYSLYYANSFIFNTLDAYFKKDRFTKKRLIIGALASFLVSMILLDSFAFSLRLLQAISIVKSNKSKINKGRKGEDIFAHFENQIF